MFSLSRSLFLSRARALSLPLARTMQWNFGYTVYNVQGSPPQNVAVGRVKREGFERIEGAVNFVWSGGTTKMPQDTLRQDPMNLSIGWVIESAWSSPAMEKVSRMYAQQAIDEVNLNPFILPNTHLVLEIDRVDGNVNTAKAYNSIAARAKAAGRPLAAVLAAASSHMETIYDPHMNVMVTQRSTGVPIVGYDTGAGVLSDSKKFPNFVRLYPPVSDDERRCERAMTCSVMCCVVLLCFVLWGVLFGFSSNVRFHPVPHPFSR